MSIDTIFMKSKKSEPYNSHVLESLMKQQKYFNTSTNLLCEDNALTNQKVFMYACPKGVTF